MTTLTDLSDDAVMAQLHTLVRSERGVTAELLRYLAEVDRRKLYAERGYPSLFAYCMEALHMGEPSIGVRIYAARCCQRFPEILAMLRQGELHLSAVRVLAPHLSPSNSRELLASARYKSKRQVEILVADLAPKASARSSIRKLPEPPPSQDGQPNVSQKPCVAVPEEAGAVEIPPCTGKTSAESPAATREPACSAAAKPTPPRVVNKTEPLGSNRYKVQFTATQALQAKIEEAQTLMRHRNPKGLAPVSSRIPLRERWGGDGGEHPNGVRRAQRSDGATRLWRGDHSTQNRGE